MVAKYDLVGAAERIDTALQDLVHHRNEAKVLVFTNRWGHLHAVVATHGFEGVPSADRGRKVWEFLRSRVAPEDLVLLYRIDAFTAAEYDARVAQRVADGMATELLDLDGAPGSFPDD